MDKQQIISLIEAQLAVGKISKADLLNLANQEAVLSQTQSSTPTVNSSKFFVKEESSKNLILTFYFIGAVIAIVGVGILIAQNWIEIGFAGRILVTLGISLVAYCAGLILKSPEQRTISQVMFLIAALLAPLGSYVLLQEASIDFGQTTQITVACILSIIFGTALFISKKNILLLITIGFLTWAYYAIVMKIFGFNYYNFNSIKWAGMLLGVSYLFIGYGLKSVWAPVDASDLNGKNIIQHLLYGFGTFAILTAGIFIGGIFDLIFIALIFAAFYGSVYLKSRAMLILGALFLMAHIIKLTSKYFVGSVGWPVALIVIGFLVIAVGYMTFYLNKRFISLKQG